MRRKMTIVFAACSALIFCSIFALAFGQNATTKEIGKSSRDREDRVLSMFSVVRFQNNPCYSTSAFTKGTTGYRNGTCFTAAECSQKGGLAAGTCAGSFGVCCVFLYSATGTTITSNCSYIRNPSFPTALSTTTAISYTLTKCTCNVCFIRLDFDCFTILGEGSVAEPTTGCIDKFTVTTSANPTSTAVPTICGTNTGQHIYIDAGTGCSDTVTLNFNFVGAATTRLWEIKTTQIPCGATYAPSPGCLQYQTALTGRITTFNFNPTTADSHLNSQQYSSCIRRADGYCCIQYMVCQDQTTPFSLSENPSTTAATGTSCTLDYVGITDSSATCNMQPSGATLTGKYCGAFLNTFPGATSNIPICDCTYPFAVNIVTDTTSDGGTTNRGLCLDYTQIPCT